MVNKTLKQKFKGGSHTSTLPQTISRQTYSAMSAEDQAFYDPTCVHNKLAENIGLRRRNQVRSAAAERAQTLAARQHNIASNPDVEINNTEYAALPAGQRGQWIVSRTNGPQHQQITYYRRQRPEDTLEWQVEHGPATRHFTKRQYNSLSPRLQAMLKKERVQVGMQDYEDQWIRRTAANVRELESSLEWQVEHGPATRHFTKRQYNSLNPRLQAMLKKERVQVGMQDYEDQWIRRTAANNARNLESSLEWRVANQPTIQLTRREYESLPANLQALGWVKDSVQSGMQEHTNIWRRRTPNDDIRESIAAKKRQMRSILEPYSSRHLTTGNYPQYSVEIDRYEYIQLTREEYNAYSRLDSEVDELRAQLQ